MSAANPTSVVSTRGYVDAFGGAAKAIWVTWVRAAGSSGENYLLHWDDSIDDITAAMNQATAVADTSALVVYSPSGSPVLDGDEHFTLKTHDLSLGDSSGVNITPGYYGIKAVNLLLFSDIATSTGVAVVSGVGGRTATVTWGFSSTDVMATHWVVRLTRHGVLVGDQLVPFWAKSAALTSLLPGTDYEVQVFARMRSAGLVVLDGDNSTTATAFTTDESLAAITGPTGLETRVSGLVAAAYEATTLVDGWAIADGPPGVTITATDDYVATLGGSPTTAGIYDATIQARMTSGGGVLDLDVRFVIGGGADRPFVTWLNDAAANADIQIDVRTGEVRSYKFDLAGEGVVLVRGEARKIHVLLTDRGRVLDDLPTAFRFTARKFGAPDAPQLFRVAWDDDDVDTLGGHDRAFITITPQGRVIDAIFSAFNGVPPEQAGSISITGVIEIPYTFAGITVTPVLVKTTVRQDSDQ